MAQIIFIYRNIDEYFKEKADGTDRTDASPTRKG